MHKNKISLPCDGTYLDDSVSLSTDDPKEMELLCSCSDRAAEPSGASNPVAEPSNAFGGPERENSGPRKKFLILDGSFMLSTAYYAFLPNEIRFAKEEAEKEKHFDKILHAPDISLMIVRHKEEFMLMQRYT